MPVAKRNIVCTNGVCIIKRSPAKKAVSKKAPAKKVVRKAVAKKAPAKKVVRKAASKKAPAKKTVKKVVSKKAPAKKVVKKAVSKKAPAKKVVKKVVSKKAPAKKVVKKVAAKKSPVKKARVFGPANMHIRYRSPTVRDIVYTIPDDKREQIKPAYKSLSPTSHKAFLEMAHAKKMYLNTPSAAIHTKSSPIIMEEAQSGGRRSWY